MHAWDQNARAIDFNDNLPADFFVPIEFHMGGCGGYVISGDGFLKEIKGASLGVRTGK